MYQKHFKFCTFLIQALVSANKEILQLGTARNQFMHLFIRLKHMQIKLHFIIELIGKISFQIIDFKSPVLSDAACLNELWSTCNSDD